MAQGSRQIAANDGSIDLSSERSLCRVPHITQGTFERDEKRSEYQRLPFSVPG